MKVSYPSPPDPANSVDSHRQHKKHLIFLQSEAKELTLAVSTAIEAGYRHFDCAHCYQNEDTIGAALSQQISDGRVKREDLFIASKVGVALLLLLPWLVPSSGVAGIADDLIPPCCPVCRVVLFQTHF